MRRRQVAVVLSLTVLLLFAACNQKSTLAPTEAISEAPVYDTMRVALAYAGALLAGDRAGANSLLYGDAWCTTPDFGDHMNAHFELYAATEVRSVRVEKMDIDGYVAYPPKAEAARIEFEYWNAEAEEWLTAQIFVVTVVPHDAGGRLICELPNNL